MLTVTIICEKYVDVCIININAVVKNDLCTGCGTCVGSCPLQIVNLIKNDCGTHVPHFPPEGCNHCNTCIEVCPGMDIDLKKLSQSVFSNMPPNYDIFMGNFNRCYVGSSSDSDILENSASGGLLTTTLIYALEEGIIDGALLSRLSSEDPFKVEYFLAKSVDSIKSASGSIYYPVTVNSALNILLKEEGKFAVVGLPCHIHGIRKAEEVNPKLKDKIVLHLGIFCSHTVNFNGTDFLINSLDVKKQDVDSFAFRKRGWPGGFLLKTKTGEEKFAPLDSFWPPIFGRFFFTPFRCTLCPDGTAELSDISFGDAWLPEFIDNRKGVSLIISRSEIGENLISNAKLDDKVKLTEINHSKVFESQQDQLFFKKKNITARKNLIKSLGKEYPRFGATEFLKPNLLDKFTATIPYINMKISNTKIGRIFITKLPRQFFHINGSMIQKFYARSYDKYYRENYEEKLTGERSKPNILIINSFSPNIGDLSIVESMLNSLKLVIPDANYEVMANDPFITRKILDETEVFESLGSRSGNKITQFINFLLFLRNYLWISSLDRGINLGFLGKKSTKNALTEYHNADIIISCGGGYLNDNGGYSFLGCLFDIYLGVLLKKPSILYAQSIGPFNNQFLASIAGKVLNSVNFITLRDKVSLTFIHELKVQKPSISVTADEALLLPTVGELDVIDMLHVEGVSEDIPLVTITVKPWHFPNSLNSRKSMENYIEALKDLTKHILNKYKTTVLYIPMDIPYDSVNQEDPLKRTFKRSIRSLIKRYKQRELDENDVIQLILADFKEPNVKMMDGEYKPSEIKSIIKRSNVHVATRMHSSIYASATNVPTLGIAYEPKMISFMESLDMNEFIFEIDALNSDDLITKFDELWADNDDLRKEISEKVKILTDLAHQNRNIVKKNLTI